MKIIFVEVRDLPPNEGKEAMMAGCGLDDYFYMSEEIDKLHVCACYDFASEVLDVWGSSSTEDFNWQRNGVADLEAARSFVSQIKHIEQVWDRPFMGRLGFDDVTPAVPSQPKKNFQCFVANMELTVVFSDVEPEDYGVYGIVIVPKDDEPYTIGSAYFGHPNGKKETGWYSEDSGDAYHIETKNFEWWIRNVCPPYNIRKSEK
jgi:hypothetical protein